MQSWLRNPCATSAFAFAFAFGPLAASAQNVEHALVTSRSHATFDVTHLYVEHVTGTIPIVSGQATFASGDTGVPTSVEATLDPRRIDTRDGDRDDDLQGPDFFDVKRFPTWTFASSSVVPVASGFTLRGTLVVHGVGQPLTLEVTTLHGFPRPHYRATGKVDRHAFGMRITPFDGTIGNDIDVTLDVELQ